MDFPRQRLFARIALLVFCGLCGAWLLRLDYAQKISTNVLDLIPDAEKSPELGVVRGLASDVQARVMLFALHDPSAPQVPPAAAAQVFAAGLKRAPEFASAVVIGDDAAQTAMGKRVFEHRFELLLPSWLAEREAEFAATGQPPENFSRWLAERSAGALEKFLTRPEAAAMQDLLPLDPLLLLPELIDRARLIAPAGGNADGHALVWGQIKVSPLGEEGQKPVFAAIDRALAQVRAAHPGVMLRWTGVNRFAAASRARIEFELGLLNACSVLAVLGVSCFFVRRVYKLLHLVPVIALSTVGAWVFATMVFDRLHILVFVIGSLLAGVAIDYGFYIYMQPPLHDAETYGEKIRRLLKPLLASCLTTVIGFLLLLFSELPLIRQIGVFVAAGLLCALAVAILYFAQLERPLLEGRRWDLARPASALTRWAFPALAALVAMVALGGPWLLQWRDDIRELDLPSRDLHENDAALRRMFGDSATRTVYLTHGATLIEAREKLAALLRHLAAASGSATSASGAPAGGPGAASVGLLLPREPDWRALPTRLKRLDTFGADFRAALERQGFSAESFTPFLSAWQELQARPPGGGYATVVAEFERTLTGPLGLLSNTRSAPFWFLTMVDEPPNRALPRELQSFSLKQLESLNTLFTRYRWSALQLSVIGLALVIASVFAIYPPRRGLRIALIPAGACFFVFGVMGLLGQTLNLFHLLGAFLGVCLSHNYAIFSSDNAAAGESPPVPVRLSALATAASFGVLGFSRVPVIHALGQTVALIVVTALLAVELGPIARRAWEAKSA